MAKTEQPTKVIRYGAGPEFIARDDKAVTAFVDMITESRFGNDGIYYISFAQTVNDGANPAEADIRVRLRMSTEMLQQVHTIIGNQLAGMKPKRAAN